MHPSTGLSADRQAQGDTIFTQSNIAKPSLKTKDSSALKYFDESILF